MYIVITVQNIDLLGIKNPEMDEQTCVEPPVFC